jgi:hypothetical protein
VLIALMLFHVSVGLVLLQLNVLHLVYISGLVNINIINRRSNNPRLSLASFLHVGTISTTSTASYDDTCSALEARATEADQFYGDLVEAGLSLCHGALHASGCRRLSDLTKLTPNQITTLGPDAFDLQCLHRVIADQKGQGEEHVAAANDVVLSTLVHGAFVNTKNLDRFSVAKTHDFEFQVISSEHDIFKGRLFTLEQCAQLNRMSEYHAYKGKIVGSRVGAGWTNEICECKMREQRYYFHLSRLLLTFAFLYCLDATISTSFSSFYICLLLCHCYCSIINCW